MPAQLAPHTQARARAPAAMCSSFPTRATVGLPCSLSDRASASRLRRRSRVVTRTLAPFEIRYSTATGRPAAAAYDRGWGVCKRVWFGVRIVRRLAPVERRKWTAAGRPAAAAYDKGLCVRVCFSVGHGSGHVHAAVLRGGRLKGIVYAPCGSAASTANSTGYIAAGATKDASAHPRLRTVSPLGRVSSTTPGSASISAARQSTSPLSAAKCAGVPPWLSAARGSAPAASSGRRQATWPLCAASSSGLNNKW